MLEVPPDPEKVAELIHALEDRYGGSVPLRRDELRALRSEYMVVKVAARLRKRADYANSSDLELRSAAAGIIAKSGSKTASQPSNDRISAEEDRYVGSARVGWHKILRAEGLTPAQSWKRATATIPKRDKRLAAATFKANDPEVQMLIHRYVAKHALQLLNACEEARELRRDAVAPQIEQALANLYAVCMEYIGGSKQYPNEKPLSSTALQG